MSLKDLTKEKHLEAESTLFMKAVFDKTLPQGLWIDWTYQKWIFYSAIEHVAQKNDLLLDLPDISRTVHLFTDYETMNVDKKIYDVRPEVVKYCNYIHSIADDPKKIMAHLYTWHMGDMFGGQMIKKLVPGSHRSLDFDDVGNLVSNIRTKIDDTMGDEANVAFDWAIRIMKDYDCSLG